MVCSLALIKYAQNVLISQSSTANVLDVHSSTLFKLQAAHWI